METQSPNEVPQELAQAVGALKSLDDVLALPEALENERSFVWHAFRQKGGYEMRFPFFMKDGVLHRGVGC